MTISTERLATAGPGLRPLRRRRARRSTASGSAERGFELREIDGAAIAGKEELLDALAAALEFPDYFGGNWDALEEVLRDLGWLPAEGYVLVVRDGDRALARGAEGGRAAWSSRGSSAPRNGPAARPRSTSSSPGSSPRPRSETDLKGLTL